MLVHLFLWFHLSTIIVFECNGFQGIQGTEEKSASRKYRNPDRGLKKHFVRHKTSSLLTLDDKALLDTPVDRALPDVNINDLISKLRNNWEAPSTYLEKRGYLAKRNSKSEMKQQRERNGNSLQINFKNDEEHERELSKGSLINLKNQKTFFYFPTLKKSKKQSENTTENPATIESTEPQSSETPANTTAEQEEEPRAKVVHPQSDKPHSDNFISKFKLKLENLFHPSKNISHNRLSDNSKSQPNRKNSQKFFDFKYDDSWLKDGNNDIFDMDNDNTGCSRDSLMGSNDSDRTPPCSSGNCDGSTDPISTQDITIKYADIFKNLTQADLDYVKNFLICFKENKQKFFTEYLHMNNTESSVGGGGSVLNSSATDICTPIDPDKPKPKHPNTTTTNCKPTTTKKMTPKNVTEMITKKMPKPSDDEVKLDIAIKSNNTGNGTCCPNAGQHLKPISKVASPTCKTLQEQESSVNYNKSQKLMGSNSATVAQKPPDSCSSSAATAESSSARFSNKLKFLAHLHHSVYEVGKLPHKPLNLTMIQQMIDDVRRNIGVVVVGDSNSSKCTPIRLNELNLDLEWSSQQDPLGKDWTSWDDASNVEKTQHTREDIISEYLKDSPDKPLKYPLSSPFSENFLDPDENVQLHQGGSTDGWLFNKIKKKREIALPETLFGSEYADLSSSLKLFNGNVKQPVNIEDYYDDYAGGSEVRARKTLKDSEECDDNDYDDDEGDSDESEIFGRKKKKKRKRKKKKKYYKKSNGNGQGEKDAYVEFPSRGIPGEFINENDVMAAPMSDPNEEEPRIDEVPKEDYFTGYSELGDIKFRVNADQEEAIEKFIESLNSPPEIFNFDVDKFIRTKSIVEPPLHIDTPPQKTFYEFMMPPAVENEKVPYIAEDSAQEHPEGAFTSTSAKENRNVHNKRDILRQYIKGISNRLQDIYPSSRVHTEENPDSKIQTRSDSMVLNRDEALINNYASDLDALNYGRFDVGSEKPCADDFVDKFYLLNDGSFSIYGADKKSAATKDEKPKIDPVSLGLDLDLEKKFQDLHIGRPGLAVGKCTNMDCSQAKEFDTSSENAFNNIDTMYIPASSFHKSDKENVATEKTCEKCTHFKRK